MRDDMGIAGLVTAGTVLGLAILVYGVEHGSYPIQGVGGAVIVGSIFLLAGFLIRIEGPEDSGH